MSPFLWVYGIIVASAFKNAGDASSLKTWEMLGPAAAERGKSTTALQFRTADRETLVQLPQKICQAVSGSALFIPYCHFHVAY
jgi:hypothetical protein